MLALRRQRLRRNDVDDEFGRAGHAPERADERDVVDIRRNRRAKPGSRPIADRNGLHRTCRIDDRLQQ